jgi:hypothetical protein
MDAAHEGELGSEPSRHEDSAEEAEAEEVDTAGWSLDGGEAGQPGATVLRGADARLGAAASPAATLVVEGGWVRSPGSDGDGASHRGAGAAAGFSSCPLLPTSMSQPACHATALPSGSPAGLHDTAVTPVLHLAEAVPHLRLGAEPIGGACEEAYWLLATGAAAATPPPLASADTLTPAPASEEGDDSATPLPSGGQDASTRGLPPASGLRPLTLANRFSPAAGIEPRYPSDSSMQPPDGSPATGEPRAASPMGDAAFAEPTRVGTRVGTCAHDALLLRTFLPDGVASSSQESFSFATQPPSPPPHLQLPLPFRTPVLLPPPAQPIEQAGGGAAGLLAKRTSRTPSSLLMTQGRRKRRDTAVSGPPDAAAPAAPDAAHVTSSVAPEASRAGRNLPGPSVRQSRPFAGAAAAGPSQQRAGRGQATSPVLEPASGSAKERGWRVAPSDGQVGQVGRPRASQPPGESRAAGAAAAAPAGSFLRLWQVRRAHALPGRRTAARGTSFSSSKSVGARRPSCSYVVCTCIHVLIYISIYRLATILLAAARRPPRRHPWRPQYWAPHRSGRYGT